MGGGQCTYLTVYCLWSKKQLTVKYFIIYIQHKLIGLLNTGKYSNLVINIEIQNWGGGGGVTQKNPIPV